MAKILLIQLPGNDLSNKRLKEEKYQSRDLGILILASKLYSEGHSVTLIPGYNSYEESIKKINNEIKNTEIVGITCLTHNYHIAKEFAELCKKLNENVIVILGGHHATWMYEDIFKENSSVDFIIRGEGEQPIIDFANNFDKKRPLHEIKGISIKEKENILECGFGTLQNPITKLDKKILKDYLQEATEKFKKIDFITELSRGCPYDCKHCAETLVVGKKYRLKNLDDFREELQILNEFNKKIDYVFFCDSNFAASPERLQQLKNILKEENNNLNFAANLRIEMMTKEYTELLKKSSINYTSFGVEHFHPNVLKIDNKVSSFKNALIATRNCKDQGIKNHINFIVGLPGDNVKYSTYSYLRAKYLFDKRLADSIEANIFIPYPGTDFFNNPNKYGLKLHSDNWKNYCRSNYPLISYDDFNRVEIWGQYLLFSSISHFDEIEKNKNILSEVVDF